MNKHNTYKTGERFGKFVLLTPASNRVSRTYHTYTRWECKCDCGNIFIITTKQIRRGQKSCGCHKLTSQFRKVLSDEQANINKVISHYKVGARRRNIGWQLTIEQATKFLLSNCTYCGAKPSRECDYLIHCKPVLVSGIDRIDSNKGYFIENCVSCCKICNVAKSDLIEEEFDNWLKRIVNYRFGVKINASSLRK